MTHAPVRISGIRHNVLQKKWHSLCKILKCEENGSIAFAFVIACLQGHIHINTKHMMNFDIRLEFLSMKKGM